MTPERIAEIEAAGADPKLDQGVMLIAELPELCRLARLGLRVEGAPVTNVLPGVFKLNARISNGVPDSWIGKRVALVVLEDSK